MTGDAGGDGPGYGGMGRASELACTMLWQSNGTSFTWTNHRQAKEDLRAAVNLRTTTLPDPPEPITSETVKQVRDAVNASQAVFARYLNVSQAVTGRKSRPTTSARAVEGTGLGFTLQGSHAAIL
jgi:DNA-binding transcriptional regulator YiaG